MAVVKGVREKVPCQYLAIKGNNILDTSPMVWHDRHTVWRGSRWKWPYDHGKHLIMALELLAYADEAGDVTKPYCVVAGFIASPRQWKRFEASWKKALSEYGVPDFHAKDFFSRKNQGEGANYYRDWPEQRAGGFLRSLRDAISSHRVHPIAVAVDVTAFKSFSDGERRMLTGGAYNNGRWTRMGNPRRPYYLALRGLFEDAAKHIQHGAMVHFILDQNPHVEGAARLIFKRICEIGKEGWHQDWAKLQAGRLMFANRKVEVGLQAADLHAHIVYNYWTRPHAIFPEDRLVALQTIARKRPYVYLWDKKHMEDHLNKLPPEERARIKGVGSG